MTTEYTTVRKAMAVVSAFSYGEPVLGVSELARRLGIGKSTVHRILTTLVADGYVERTHDERYRLSIKMYEIGQQVAASIELRELVHPALERLRNESGETAHVGVLSGTDVVYVDRLESPHMIRWLTAVGRRRGAHATSTGKCLLAFGPPADVARVVAGGLPKLGPRTITSRSMLERALAKIRVDGYAVSVDEAVPGVVSVAAPLFDGARRLHRRDVGGRSRQPDAAREGRPLRAARGPRRGQRRPREGRPVSVSDASVRTPPCRSPRSACGLRLAAGRCAGSRARR